jgi:hypothetical protein
MQNNKLVLLAIFGLLLPIPLKVMDSLTRDRISETLGKGEASPPQREVQNRPLSELENIDEEPPSLNEVFKTVPQAASSVSQPPLTPILDEERRQSARHFLATRVPTLPGCAPKPLATKKDSNFCSEVRVDSYVIFTNYMLAAVGRFSPYDILGLKERTSDKAEIDRAYRRAILIHHPDKSIEKNSVTSEDCRRLNTAFELLSNDKARDIYDNPEEYVRFWIVVHTCIIAGIICVVIGFIVVSYKIGKGIFFLMRRLIKGPAKKPTSPLTVHHFTVPEPPLKTAVNQEGHT